MRVLHVSQPVSGGVATVVNNLLRDQVSLGVEAHCACPSGPLAEVALDQGVWHPWRAGREPGPTVLKESFDLRRIIEATRPDILHLHSAKAGLCGRLVARGRIPTIFQPHGWSFLAASGQTAELVKTWERAATRWTTALVCVSQDEAAIGRAAKVNSRRCVTWLNAVRLEWFLHEDRATARAKLLLPQDVPLAICVGRLTRQKGMDLLLAAWREVRSRVPDAHLVIVGSGDDADMLQARAADWPEVHFAGEQSEIHLYYSSADVVILPSRYEGMALAPLEAMASARSVVGFDVPGLRDCLPDESCIAPAGSTAALAALVVERLTNPERADGEGKHNLTRAQSDFDARTASAAMMSLYETLLAEFRRSTTG